MGITCVAALPRRSQLRLAALALSTFGCGAAGADETVLTKEELIERHPQLQRENVADSPVSGLYELNVDGGISYVTTDGRFLIRGEIIDLDSRENLTEARRAENRAAVLRSIDPAAQIVFSPANGVVNHRITVFTDVDCGYCRQLHRDIDVITSLGIEVHYVAYPRTGPATDSWTKAEHVWCAANRQEALTTAKLGGDVPAATDCATTAVAEQFALGRSIGLQGTPGVYAENGTELGGYLPPAVLLEALHKLADTK